MEDRIKATKEQADKLEFINAEIKRLEDKSGSDFEIFKLMQEKEQLQSDYDWHDEVFEENGKKGLVDTSGNWILPQVFDYLSAPSQGMIAAFDKSVGWQVFRMMSK